MQRKSAAFKTRAFEWDTKAVKDDGLFSGYGSVFGVVDSYREVVAPGAFKASLADLEAKGRSLPILWQHRTGEPIGDWTSLVEDTTGLKGDGALWLDDAPYAKIAYRGMKAKAITGLSIGYYVRDDSFDEKTRVRTLKAVDLVEVSIVTVPANDAARIDAVKSAIAHGALPSLSDFEGLLREAGFSKSQAAVIANRGLKHLLQSESGSTANDVNRLLDTDDVTSNASGLATIPVSPPFRRAPADNAAITLNKPRATMMLTADENSISTLPGRVSDSVVIAMTEVFT